MSVSLDTLERIKAQLKEVKDMGNNINLDLYQHLTEVFNRIMLHHQEDAFHKFEEISHLIKQTHLKIDSGLRHYIVYEFYKSDNLRITWIVNLF